MLDYASRIMQCSAPLPRYHLTDTAGKTLVRIKHTYSWPVRLHGCIISPRTTRTSPYLLDTLVYLLSSRCSLHLLHCTWSRFSSYGQLWTLLLYVSRERGVEEDERYLQILLGQDVLTSSRWQVREGVYRYEGMGMEISAFSFIIPSFWLGS